MPVWTSSKISAAPCSSQAARAPQVVRHRATPGLALHGLDHAAAAGPTLAARQRLGVGIDGAEPGTSGANGACLASCGVADSAPYVRPWKRPPKDDDLTSGARATRELERRLHRLGARVGEEHLAAERARREPLASRTIGAV